MDRTLTPHRLARFRVVIGLSLLWLGAAALLASYTRWHRVFEKPAEVTAGSLERLTTERPKQLLLRITDASLQRTDLFRDDATRYWGLPLVHTFLLVRRDAYEKQDGPLEGALERLDTVDEAALEKIDWLALYRRAKIPEYSKAKLLPYVLVAPYRSGADIVMLSVLGAVVLVGIALTIRGVQHFRAVAKELAKLAPPEPQPLRRLS